MNLLFMFLDSLSRQFILNEYIFRAAFFVMLLCMLVLAETFIIMLLHRYTAVGVVLLSLLMMLIFYPGPSEGPSAKGYLFRILTPFMANKYTRLYPIDVIMLLLLNSLVLCLMLTLMLKEHSLKEEILPGKKKDKHR